MVQAYAVELERRGKAWNTIRLDLDPIKLTWRYMAENYPELVRPLARVKLNTPPRARIECLGPREVAELLDWLRIHAQNLWPMGCLQALAGLRMLEAAALRFQDVDFERRTVEVTDTGRHKPKTRNSYRVIPVCDDVMDALRITITMQKVKPASGELFTTQAGALWTLNGLSQRWAQALRRAARDLGILRLSQIPARKLRASFVTMASSGGSPDWLLKTYLGHASGDVLGDHYRRIDLAELRAVSSLMDRWRDRIIDPDAGEILATRQIDDS